MIAVCNASPLIYLGRVGRLSLLPQLFKEVFSTPYVIFEVTEDRHGGAEMVLVKDATEEWLHVRKPEDKEMVDRLMNDLLIHQGEASTIVLALELKFKEKVVVLDDRLARSVATSLNLDCLGTIGVLLLGLEEGICTYEEFRMDFQHLCEETDFRISVSLYNRVLSLGRQISDRLSTVEE